MFDWLRNNDSLLSELLAVLKGAKLQDLLFWINEYRKAVRSELVANVRHELAPEDVVLELAVGNQHFLYESCLKDVSVILKDLLVEGKWLVLLDAELHKLVCASCILLDFLESLKHGLHIHRVGLSRLGLRRLLLLDRQGTGLESHLVKRMRARVELLSHRFGSDVLRLDLETGLDGLLYGWLKLLTILNGLVSVVDVVVDADVFSSARLGVLQRDIGSHVLTGHLDLLLRHASLVFGRRLGVLGRSVVLDEHFLTAHVRLLLGVHKRLIGTTLPVRHLNGFVALLDLRLPHCSGLLRILDRLVRVLDVLL